LVCFIVLGLFSLGNSILGVGENRIESESDISGTVIFLPRKWVFPEFIFNLREKFDFP
jgi:hypothetical protein